MNITHSRLFIPTVSKLTTASTYFRKPWKIIIDLVSCFLPWSWQWNKWLCVLSRCAISQPISPWEHSGAKRLMINIIVAYFISFWIMNVLNSEWLILFMVVNPLNMRCNTKHLQHTENIHIKTSKVNRICTWNYSVVHSQIIFFL